MTITIAMESLEKILHYIDATIVLHNMSIKFGEDKELDAPWDVAEETLSDIGNTTHIPERDVMDLPVPLGSQPDT